MRRNLKTLVCMTLAGILAVQTPIMQVRADEITGDNSLAGITEALSRYYENASRSENTDTTELYAVAFNAPENLAIAEVSNSLNIRKGPGTEYSKVGILAKDAACIVESIDKNGWAKITSGSVSGYVSTEYLLMGDEAVQRAQQIATLYATVNSKVVSLNVRSAASTKSSVITKVKAGEKMLVSKEVVVNKEDETSKLWVEIYLDDEDNENAVAYVSADYVTVSYELQWASKYSPYGPDVSDLRISICDYAKKFIGTPYKWGGNDLTKGIDCSGFVQKVYAKFGYTTPRVSRDMAKKYKTIALKDAKPGDLIFYGNASTGYINHVGIYIGNNQLLHSSTNYKGVAISSIYFYSILKVCRIIDD